MHAPAPPDMTGPDLVSVVIPVFNAADLVRAAVASVQRQTWPSWELFLIDDGSTDGSAAILAALAAADPRIRVLATSAPGSGPGPARNLGIAAARGRYVAFLDADDQWHPEKLARQIPEMQWQGAVLSCTAYRRVNQSTGRQTLIGVPDRITRRMLLQTNLIACSTAVFDRTAFPDARMPDLRRRQDYAFWLQLLQGGRVAVGVPEVLMTYLQRPQSVSSSKWRAAASTWAMYRGTVGLGVLETLGCFAQYGMRGIARHRAPGLARRLGWLHPVQDMPEPDDRP